LADAAGFELRQFVAQRGDACWRDIGLLEYFGKEIAWMRLKGQNACGHAALSRFVVQQRQHGLVATVHTIEITDGQRTGLRQFRMLNASVNLHV
jgi:hypothetical protein